MADGTPAYLFFSKASKDVQSVVCQVGQASTPRS